MKKKRIIIAKSVMAAAVASSVFAVTNTADAASQTKADKAVVKAEKLSGALKWETSLEYRKAKYPKNVVGYPTMKLHNDTKQALVDARKAVSTLKGTEKEHLSARLDAVATYVNRSTAYIDAVTSGLKIQKKYNELHARYVKGVVDDQTQALYSQLSYEIKKNSHILDRVYGATTRAEFRKFYKQTAENQLADLIYPVTIKIEIDRANTALKSGNIEEAAKRLGNVDFFVKEAAVNKGQKENNKLIVSSLSKLKAAQDAFNKQGVLYIAKSTDATAPTTFGPATGSESTNKTVYIYGGLNSQLKLQNLSIDGNLVILGSPAGAGSVYLENVKVNKVDNSSGNIVVEDIADHSLHMKGVQAESIVVNDANGSNIIAEQGTKVKSLVVSEKAGAKGKATLESQEKGSIGTITVASKGSSSSQGVELKGDLSDTPVTVTGQNAAINVAKGAVVKELDFKAPAKVTVSEGSTVQEVKKDSSVTGEVKLDNKGTVEKADSNVSVDGNKPGEVTQPAAGGGGGGGVVTTPALNNIVVQMANGTHNYSATVSNNSLTLNLDNMVQTGDIFTGIQINTSNASKFRVTSLTIGTTNSEHPISIPSEYTINGNTTTITSQSLFGVSGISKDYADLLSGQSVKLTGNLISSDNISQEINITLNLGSNTGVVTKSLPNNYGTVTNVSNDHYNVALNQSDKDVLIKDVTTADGTEVINNLIAFATGNVTLDSDLIKAAISLKVGKAWNQITLGDLVGSIGIRTIIQDGITVDFVWA